jgi:protein involved in polysaccharide export with SLBB domain
LVALLANLSGCAALTNPVANGVPVRMLPPELLASPVEDLEPVPLDWLQVERPEVYRLAPGDIIGVYIDGALGDRNELPPINFPQGGDLPPSTGFPLPIAEDGTVSLPLVNKVKVDGMTVDEAQKAIRDAYIEGDRQFLLPEGTRILVTIARPRQARVLVIREDAPNVNPSVNDPTYRLFGSAPSLGIRAQGTGSPLEIAEVEADVLNALARTGGLPGPTAANEVIIYRGVTKDTGYSSLDEWRNLPTSGDGVKEPRVRRIPLRIRPGTAKPFSEDDVKLQSGDIVFVPPRETDVYYTGGLLPAREVPLPRDNDIHVVEAILRVGGSVVSGGAIIGTFQNSLSFATGIENSNPSLVTVIRRTPNGGQVIIRVDLNRALRDPRENLLVRAGDVIVLQETPAEAVSRYMATVFNFGIFTEVFRSGSAAGQATANLP